VNALLADSHIQRIDPKVVESDEVSNIEHVEEEVLVQLLFFIDWQELEVPTQLLETHVIFFQL